jgi:hypothetical protein
MLRGQGNIIGFGNKHPNRTWIEVWETDQQFVLWCLEKLHDGNLSRWGSAKLGHLTSFVTWVKRMGVAEHKAGKDRPVCRRHEVAMSGPLTAHRETILPQNQGRLFFACPHKCQGCRNNNLCLGGDCCGQDQEGFLWADGSERGSAVSMERKRRYDEKHSQEPTEPPPTMERPTKRSRVTVAAAEKEDKDEAVKEKEAAEEEPVPEEEKEQQEQDGDENEDGEPKAPCPECGVLKSASYLGCHGGWRMECNINERAAREIHTLHAESTLARS